jgi:phosphoglycerate dehydrogenase-like enzyme
MRSALPADVIWDVCESSQQAEIAKRIPDATIYVGGLFTPAMAEVARELQFIQVPGAGLDQITLDALPPGVVVANTYNHEHSIAEYVVMAMLALSRRLLRADADLRQGIWSANRSVYRSLRGQTIGLVGFGHIGREVAKLAACFEMTILAIDRMHDPLLAVQTGIAFLGGPAYLPALITRSDFVVVAAPLTDETRGWIGAGELDLLKPTAFLINVSRADIVEETALYRILSEHRIAGAALDVWYQYPEDATPTLPAHLPFHLLDNVILTPHYCAATEETRNGRLADVKRNLENWLEGKPLQNVVPRAPGSRP